MRCSPRERAGSRWRRAASPARKRWNALTLGEGERQPGPELAAYWFLRNAKIMNKLAQVTKPGDRVVLVFGAGHSHWLREMVEKTRGFELEPIQPYPARADAAARD